MARVTYLSLPDLPVTTINLGVAFVAGEPVEVSGEKALAKFRGHPHFAVSDDLPNPKGEPVEIPADWEDLHWSQQEKLALEIVGGEGPLVPAEGQTRAEKARAIIASEVIGRSE